MALYEITSDATFFGYGEVTAAVVDNRTIQNTNENITISGVVTLVSNLSGAPTSPQGLRHIASAYVDNVNVVIGTETVFTVDNKSVSTGLVGGANTNTSIILGSYSKTISKQHTASSVAVKLTATNLYASLVYNDGWQGSSTKITHTDTATVTVSAKPSYTITYNANGGSSTPASQTKWYNEPITLQSAITRTGYNFGGWKWKNSGSVIASGSSWNGANANGTFYAAWEYKWKKPSFTKLTAWRTDTTASGGVYPKKDDGTNADIQVVLNSGSKKESYGSAWTTAGTTVKFYYKAHSASAYTLISTQTLSSASGTLTAHISNILNTETQYDVKVEAYITDYSAESVSFTTFISTAFFLVDMTDKGIAFGRAAENDKFLCNLEMSAEGHKLSNAKVNMFDNTRQTSPDVIQDGRTGISHFLGTSSMTSGKPNTQDGHIIHLAWDNNGGWDSQLYLENGNTPKLFMRNQSNGTWGSWVKVYSPNDKPSTSDIGAVPTSRTINSKALSSNISLTASDVGAVPTSRTVNGKALSSNISLTASDVGAPAISDVYGMFSVSGVNIASADSLAAGDYKTYTYTYARSGYYPLCVARINSSGSNSTFCSIIRYGLTSQSVGSCDISVTVRNVASSSAATLTLAVYVLWVKTS